MSRVTAWRTDEPCPSCGSDLILLDNGDDPPVLPFECRVCGWSSTWPGYPAPDGFDDPDAQEAE